MSGEELDKKLKKAGYVLADVARLLGVPPQSINQTLNAKDVKSGFLEDLCRVLEKDIRFFYDIPTQPQPAENPDESLLRQIAELQEENQRLRDELRHKEDPERCKKESEVYQLWMEYMRIEEMRAEFNNRMQDIYRKQMEG